MNRTQKRKKTKRAHPDDQGRLIMDKIYDSDCPEVQEACQKIIAEEMAHGIDEPDAFDRIHMRVGKKFFHLLSQTMQARFQREYPQAHNILSTAI